jgi:carbon catabolite-derepressing protein kinase
MLPPGVAHSSSTHSSRVDLVGSARRSTSQSSQPDAPAESGTASHVGPASGRNSAAGSATGDHLESGRSSKAGNYAEPDESVYVYITIQIYSIEREFFLVDFKCAGYERLVQKLVREIRETGGIETTQFTQREEQSTETGGNIDIDDSDFNWRPISSSENIAGNLDVREREETVGAGRASGEKRATSAFPFLDVASRLIIQLAEGE